MSVSAAQAAASFFSMKLELKTITSVILTLFLLMIGIIFLLTQLGIEIVSGLDHDLPAQPLRGPNGGGHREK